VAREPLLFALDRPSPGGVNSEEVSGQSGTGEVMDQQDFPTGLGVIIGLAVLGALIFAGVIVAAVLVAGSS